MEREERRRGIARAVRRARHPGERQDRRQTARATRLQPQAAKKFVEGKQHPDRNAQFEHIAGQAKRCVERGVPFISVDTKKTQLVGNFKNAGVEWQPKDAPELVDVHDFSNDALGKAIRTASTMSRTTAASLTSAPTTTHRCSP